MNHFLGDGVAEKLIALLEAFNGERDEARLKVGFAERLEGNDSGKEFAGLGHRRGIRPSDVLSAPGWRNLRIRAPPGCGRGGRRRVHPSGLGGRGGR